MVTSKFLEWQPPPPPHRNFDGLPNPHLRGYLRIFFIKISAKEKLKVTYLPMVEVDEDYFV